MESNTNNKKPSTVKVRMEIQKLLEKNMRPATGRFHCKELNETGFVNDLFKSFDIDLKKI